MSDENETTQDLDCSPGAKILIENLRANPDSLWGDGRWAGLERTLTGVSNGESWQSDSAAVLLHGLFSERDKRAVLAVIDECREEKLTVAVTEELFQNKSQRLREERRERELQAARAQQKIHAQQIAGMMNSQNNGGYLGGAGGSGLGNTVWSEYSSGVNELKDIGGTLRASPTKLEKDETSFADHFKSLFGGTKK